MTKEDRGPRASVLTIVCEWIVSRPEWKASRRKLVRAYVVTAAGLCVLSALAYYLINETCFCRSLGHQGLAQIVKGGTEGASKLFAILSAVVWVLLRLNGRVLLTALLGLLLTGAVVSAIKVTVNRPRPSYTPEEIETAKPVASSFPSGDAAMAFAVAAALAPFVTLRWRAGLYVLAAGVGIHRVSVVAHHPSDVIAGAAVGVLCSLAALALLSRFLRPRGQLLASR